MTPDPFVLAATAVYLLTALGMAAVLSGMRILGRGGVWDRIRSTVDHAKQLGPATAAPLPGGRHGDAVILAKGGLAAILPGARDLAKIDKAALVKDKDGQTGIVLHAGGKTTCVAGIEPMARAWSRLQADEVPVEVVFRDDEAQRVNNVMRTLHPREQEMLAKWLVQGEVVTDIIKGVDYEGALKTAGSKGIATLVVTNRRAGLIGQTVLVERVGNMQRTTTSFSFTTYLLPLASSVTFERAPSLSTAQWRVKLELPKDLPAELADLQKDVPTLLLGPDHAGVFLPLVVFRRPTAVTDAGGGFGRVIGEAIFPGIGCGILLGGIFAGIAGAMYGNHTYFGRYVIPAALCGAITPAIFKLFALLESYMERSRARWPETA